MKFKVLWMAGLVFAATAGQVQAAFITLAENLHVNGEEAGNNHFSSGSTFGAENFSLGGIFDVTRISFVAHHNSAGSQPISIDWSIHLDGAGLPGTVISSGNTSSYSTSIEGTAFGGFYDLTRYSIDISPITLGVGNYWVAFHNNTVFGNDPHWTFARSGTSFDGLSAISFDGGSTWGSPYPGDNMTFRVEGFSSAAVPEPASLAMWGFGALGAMFARCKRKQMNRAV
ncbi:MAG: PEP-CTERM sorting domain-containing protein [Planctomyces sp.]|nr:PEP-CTERM sorting domain-containing protein [Planctomyces sp.]